MNTNYSKLTITYRPVGTIQSNPHNSRTHSKRQIRQIADSIQAFGFTNPVLLDDKNTIIAGHGRVEAAKLLGIPEVPTIQRKDLSPDQIRAYVIADNKLAANAGWDNSILAIELQHLLNIDTEFDITVTGFEIPEIDLLLSPEDERTDTDDVFEVEEDAQPITQTGDIWNLGKHKVLCGDASDESSYPKLLNAKRAAVVLVDPPYNVPIDGNVCGKGAIHHREFQMASGEMSEPEFIAFLTTRLKLLARYSAAGSVHFVFMDWRHMGELIAAGKQAYDALLNVCVWVKNNGGMGSFYRSRHELVFVFRNKGKHRNNIQLGKYGRNRTNVWEYPSINSVSKCSDEGNLLALHPTVKPVRLVADALLDCSARGDLVLDTFLGSGTTLLAAEQIGRICGGVELDPIYVDTAIKRWQRHTGDHAVHAVSGKRFDDVANECLEVTHG